VFACVLWGKDVISSWLTSLSIPFLSIVFKISDDDSFEKKQKKHLMSPLTFLLIGICTKETAVSEKDLDKMFAFVC
jgi:hypothetical protein